MEWEQLGLLAVGAGVDGGYAAKTWEVLSAGLRLDRPSVGPLKLGQTHQPLAPWPSPGHFILPRRAALVAGAQEVGVAGTWRPRLLSATT